MVLLKKGFLFACVLMFFTAAYAKNKPAKKNAGGTFIEAYTQRTLPGRREGRIISATHIIIVWQRTDPPKSFIWKPDSTAQNCSFAKVHKIEENKSQRFPDGIAYEPENISVDKIHKGDTLDVTPITSSVALVPASSKSLKSALLYISSKNSSWHSLPVPPITKRRDIAMP